MFAVNVPRGAREEHVRAVAAANEPAHAFDLSGIAVLVIDEDRAVREGLERLLTKWRCQVIAVESGAQAMQQLAARAKEGRCPPDIIIVDYRLRELANNLTVLQQLEREIVEMPALVVTAASAQERRDCEASGVPVLTKPVNAARLRTLLAHIAARVRTGGARRAG
jgi:CheY-like chemotaxis protein